MSGNIRLVFAGTGDIALPAFRALLAAGRMPLALVTQPDRPAGRKMQLTPPRIKSEALAAGIPVFQPEKISDISEDLRTFRPDVIIVMAYGQILRKSILTLPALAIINLHASLLPKYRGAACIQAAIDAGDAESGITAMHVARALDAGDVITARKIPLAADETGGSLHDKLAELAPEVLLDTLALLAGGDAPRIPQDEAEVSYIGKLERADGLLDWSLPAETLERRIRAYDPWPGTFTMVSEDGKTRRLKILPPTVASDAAVTQGEVSAVSGKLVIGCGGGSALEILRVQPDGGRVCTAEEYLRGRRSLALAE